MNIVKKSGCILLNKQIKKIGLVFRNKQQDYSFPKGHLENGESLEECAVRETEEETGRLCYIIKTKPLPTLSYKDSNGNQTISYYFLAEDLGKSNSIFSEELTHKTIWVSFDDVESKLSYQNLVDFWNEIKELVAESL